MVTRTGRFLWPTETLRRWSRPGVALLAALLLGTACLLLSPQPAEAQGSSLYFLTVKWGITDASGSGETLFSTLESTHGALQSSRATDFTSTELDIYGVSGSGAGLAVGVDLQGYEQEWHFADGESVFMKTFGVLFTFKTYARLGSVFPFLGLGMGNYYVNYGQTQANIFFRDSPAAVYTGRIGVRMLLGRVGLLLEGGDTRARLPVATDAGKADVELGGRYAALGLSLVY